MGVAHHQMMVGHTLEVPCLCEKTSPFSNVGVADLLDGIISLEPVPPIRCPGWNPQTIQGWSSCKSLGPGLLRKSLARGPCFCPSMVQRSHGLGLKTGVVGMGWDEFKPAAHSMDQFDPPTIPSSDMKR